MKKVAMFLAGVAGIMAAAVLFPATALANCPNFSQMNLALCSSGGQIQFDPLEATNLTGIVWQQGAGNPAIGAGIDSGLLSGAGSDGTWLSFAEPGIYCVEFDWADASVDGCPDGLTPLWISANHGKNRGMLASVSGKDAAGGPGTPAGPSYYDFGGSINGGPSSYGGTTNGLALGRAVQVTSSSTAAGVVTANVAAFAVPSYFDSSRALPGTLQLHGRNGASDVVLAGSGAKAIGVTGDTDLCWEIADGALTIPVGCVHVGGLTPSQNVLNAKATIGKGDLKFSWDVSAQFDVLGFNVIQKNATKNTERVVNSTLIPINGMNDAQAASYTFAAGRKDLQATRGGFEIELVRTNGETSRTPAPLK